MVGTLYQCSGTQSSLACSGSLSSSCNRQSYILLSTDNISVWAYLNKKGWGRSRVLSFMTTKLVVWRTRRQVCLTARFVPSKLNVLADTLREEGRLTTEYTLKRALCLRFSNLGSPSHRLVHHEVEQSPSSVHVSHSGPFGMGSGYHVSSWEGMTTYAFPPIPLLLNVPSKFWRRLILWLSIKIGSVLEGQPFFDNLLSLLVVPAIRLLPTISQGSFILTTLFALCIRDQRFSICTLGCVAERSRVGIFF